MGPADSFTTASGEPMIVGPITLAICPICGPVKDRTAPHVCAEVLPAFPPTDGLFVPTQPAEPIWLPPIPIAAPPVGTIGKPNPGTTALALRASI
jgi:hypothetical protein